MLNILLSVLRRSTMSCRLSDTFLKFYTDYFGLQKSAAASKPAEDSEPDASELQYWPLSIAVLACISCIRPMNSMSYYWRQWQYIVTVKLWNWSDWFSADIWLNLFSKTFGTKILLIHYHFVCFIIIIIIIIINAEIKVTLSQ